VSEVPNTRVVAAPAKVNPFLRVLDRREDGYHNIESVILPISLADELEIHAFADPGQFRTLSLSLEVTGEPDLVRGVPVDESNLVMRAAKVLADRAGVRGFAEVHLHKRVPSAAGLGGGSSDAAAALIALNDLWGVGLDDDGLRDVAAEVGSDVPAMLRSGPVIAHGRGEDVTRVALPAYLWALVAFDFGISTRDAYAWWDEDGGRTGPPVDPLSEKLTAGPAGLGPRLFNDLEPPVVRRHPEIGRAKQVLLEAGAVGAVMSGSGPTVAGLVGDSGLMPAAEADLLAIAGRRFMLVDS
jgi:4-diphosphocytidyl-2-C-methyl-D-erythritol kinase